MGVETALIGAAISSIAGFHQQRQEKKAARSKEEAERRAALENVRVSSRTEEVNKSDTQAQQDATVAAENRRARRAGLADTVRSAAPMGAGTRNRQTLGGN